MGRLRMGGEFRQHRARGRLRPAPIAPPQTRAGASAK
jgi:hypothetical protein